MISDGGVGGRHVRFDGRFLHGVPDDAGLRGVIKGGKKKFEKRGAQQKQKQGAGGEKRITFMVNCWYNVVPSLQGFTNLKSGPGRGIFPRNTADVDERGGEEILSTLEQLVFPPGEFTAEGSENRIDDILVKSNMVDVERQPTMLKFVCDGATWGDDDDNSDSSSSDGDGEEEGLMLFILNPLPSLKPNYHNGRIRYDDEDICPRLVMVGDNEEDGEEDVVEGVEGMVIDEREEYI